MSREEMTADDVVDLLAALGAPIARSTWYSYARRGLAPAPVRRVGRTPLWDRTEVERWQATRPGRGARTDLRRSPQS